jgi:transcriptional regulator with XRE-family HTH domain
MAMHPPFGDLLKRYRQAAGSTQEELASRASLSPKTITALERGVNRAPRKETLASLASALQLTPPERAVLEAAARARDSSAPVQLMNPYIVGSPIKGSAMFFGRDYASTRGGPILTLAEQDY